MPGGLPPGGRLQIDWCISHVHCMLDRLTSESHSEGTPLNIKSRLSIQYALRVGIIQVTHTVINGISMLSVVCILWDPRRIGLVNSRDGNLGIKCFLLWYRYFASYEELEAMSTRTLFVGAKRFPVEEMYLEDLNHHFEDGLDKNHKVQILEGIKCFNMKKLEVYLNKKEKNERFVSLIFPCMHHASIHLFIYLFIYQFVCLSVCLSVYLSSIWHDCVMIKIIWVNCG